MLSGLKQFSFILPTTIGFLMISGNVEVNLFDLIRLLLESKLGDDPLLFDLIFCITV